MEAEQERQRLAGRRGGREEPAAVSLSNVSSEGEEKQPSRSGVASASVNSMLSHNSDAEGNREKRTDHEQKLTQEKGKKKRTLKKRQETNEVEDGVDDDEGSQGRPTKKSVPPSHSESDDSEIEEADFTIQTTVAGQMAENPHFTIQEAKAAAKREYNRQNASRSRLRRKRKVANLKKKCDKFEQRVEELTRENEVLRARLHFFESQNGQALADPGAAPPSGTVSDPSSQALLQQLQLQRAQQERLLAGAAANSLIPSSVSTDELAKALLVESGTARQQLTQQQQQQFQLQRQLQSLISAPAPPAATNPYSSGSISDLLQASTSLSVQQRQQLALLGQQQQLQQQPTAAGLLAAAGGIPQGLLGGAASAAAATAAAAAVVTAQPPTSSSQPSSNDQLTAFLSSLMGSNQQQNNNSKNDKAT